jgi:LSD1 subclass zinc finger protein
MTDVPASTQLLCRQCAAPLPVEQGSSFVTCDYCSTVNFLDKSEAVLHYAVRPTLDQTQAAAALRRWMAGNATVKHLDAEAQVEPPAFQLFPLWLTRAVSGEQERVLLKPAAALVVTELERLKLPASDLEPYDHAMDPAAVRPTVPLTALRTWLETNEGIVPAEIREVSLVHVPIYNFRYTYKGKPYTAMVEAAGGQVFASVYPEKAELPYLSIGGFGCLAYFLAALIPVITLAVTDGEGLLLGILIYVGVAAALAMVIFSAAAVVTRKY